MKFSESTQITIFRDIKDTDTPFYKPVGEALSRIKNGKSKDLVKKIRAEADKSKRNELKKGLPSILFSGKFRKRYDSHIEEHSGLVCLDFDNYPTAKAMSEERRRLTEDEYVFSVFESPSGKGLKVLVKIPRDADNHKLYFNALGDYFNSEHFDVTSKNLSRVCYESFDPKIYINEDSKEWTRKAEPEYQEKEVVNGILPTIPITDENKIVQILLKWWEKKYPMVEGQRNQNTYILAAAMNDFGVNRSLAEHVLMGYSTRDFTSNEIKSTIASAYSDTSKFKSKVYEDEDEMNKIRAKSKRGVSKSRIKEDLKGMGLKEEEAEAIAEEVDKESQTTIFWTKNKQGTPSIYHILFKQFLEENGFYKYFPHDSDSHVFVRIENNLITQSKESDVKDFVLSYVENTGDYEVYNYFAEKTKYFKDEFLSLLDTVDVYLMEDTKDSAYLYYRNCAVKVMKDRVEKIDYLDLGGYVWKNQIIDRVFDEVPFDGCDFQRFIFNICGSDESRVTSMKSTIGYLMHGYKDRSKSPAVILNDEVISDNPEGGTGKGILMSAIGHIKKTTIIDGKRHDFKDRFSNQFLTVDTQVLCFDDVRKNFNFEMLFSAITEGVVMEKKNRDAVRMPFEQSPKIAITTNYAIRGTGNSFERRKWDQELKQYYSKNFTPRDEFGCMLFDDWSLEEWVRFDNYMISCLTLYIKSGLIDTEFENLEARRFVAETSFDFAEWAGALDDDVKNELLQTGRKIVKQDIYYGFITDYPDYGARSKMTISRKTFYTWVNAYALYKYGVLPEEGRESTGRWIRFRDKKELNPITEKKSNQIEFDL